MKRVVIFIIISFFVTLSAWAMRPMPDESLSVITGQSGVSINPDITMDLYINTAAWGDASGLDSPWDLTNSDSGGYIGVRNFSINDLRIKSREGDTYGGYDNSHWKPVTIDVATDSGPGNLTFVRIGLGALQVTMDYMWMEVANGTAGYNLSQKLGEIYLGGLGLYLNPLSFIDIYNGRRPGVGVDFTVCSIVDGLDVYALSWGDSDGLPGGNIGDAVAWMDPGGAPGYVGLSNIQIYNTSVIGTFSIDINTSYAGTYANLNGGPVSVVHVSFPTDFNLHTSRFTAELKMDRIQQLASPDAGTLGNLYLSDLDLTILSGSWIDIWAH